MSQSISARDKILETIRTAIASPATGSSGAEGAARPSIARSVNTAARVERFMLLAREEAATAERVAVAAGVPAAVLRYLRGERLSLRLVLADNARASGILWESVPDLDWAAEPVGNDGDTAVTGCYAGVAEAGAVVTLSSGDHPSEFNFLAATHIVILHASAIVDSFEALWSRLRADYPENWPRMMNFIVGPSRTADLGVPSRLGAHGPSRVHIIIVDG